MEQPRIRIIEVFFLLILIALTYGFFLVMRPFLITIFLAAIFSSVLFPVHEKLAHRLKGRRVLASLIMILLVLVVVAVPVTFVSILVYSQAISGYNAFVRQAPQIVERLAGVSLLDWARDIPLLADYVEVIEPIQLSQVLRDAVRTGSNFVLSATQRSFVSAFAAVAGFVLMLLLMFFIFQGGRQLLASVFNVVPMPNKELREIAQETRRTTTATLVSTLIIGLLEGTYGTILFLIFGLPSAFLWGLIIVVLSMLPLIGTNLVLVPAGIILIVSGRVLSGIGMIVLGVGGVAITQNVVKPKLLGDQSGLHPALALLSTLGGIAWLGLIGFLVGPLLASLFLVVWQQFAIRYRHELAERNAGHEKTTEQGMTTAAESG